MATKTIKRNTSKVFKAMDDNSIQVIDLRFCDMLGQWQHFSITRNEFEEEAFIHGVGFDGSSIRGFQKIHESDMLLLPDPEAFFVEPFTSIPTLTIICDIEDPMTRKPYTRDSRFIAEKAEQYLKASGIADSCLVGPEAEFFILDSVRFDQSHNFGFYYLDSDEGFWNSGKEGSANGGAHNLGHKPRFKEGYFPKWH